MTADQPVRVDLFRAPLRIARPTDRLEEVVAFYRDGLGLDVLGEFQGHDGFDGVMLGREGAPWHLELTREAGAVAGRAPSEEHLLVFYLPDAVEHAAAVERLVAAGHAPVRPHNPYWARHGTTFEDPDGYRIVLQRAPWPPR